MQYAEEDYLMLSGLQHFYFCPRQWALIHLEQQWAENQATMEGNYYHQKADNPYIAESRGDLIISRAMPVSSRRLGVSGILDVVEFYREEAGVALPGREGFWRPNIVEYKRGKPKKDHRDLVQLTAQVICLEEMLECSLISSDMYYHEPNRRQKVFITDDLREETQKLAVEMHRVYAENIIPRAGTYKNCTRCSLYDLCLPRLTKRKVNVANYVAKFTEGENA